MSDRTVFVVAVLLTSGLWISAGMLALVAHWLSSNRGGHMANSHYIEILDFAEWPLGRRGAMQIFSSIARRVDRSHLGSTSLAHRTHRVDPAGYTGTPEERAVAMADAVGLSSTEWRMLPIIPWLPFMDRALARAVLAEVNRRRGYSWPVARPKPKAPEEQTAWDLVETPEQALDLLCRPAGQLIRYEEPELQEEPAPIFAPPAEACKHPCWSCPDILEDPNACQDLPGPCHWRDAWRTASPDKTHEQNRDQTKQEDKT